MLIDSCSVGFAGQKPEELFETAIDLLEAKCDKLLESL